MWKFAIYIVAHFPNRSPCPNRLPYHYLNPPFAMLENDLQSLGLTEKEARVYLAALELGQASVQKIAAAAHLPRPTCYLQINTLSQRGLMSSVEEGKKRLFIAEPPEALLTLFQREAEEVKTKQEALAHMLPELKSRMTGDELPKVRLYEGLEGLEAMRRELLKLKNTEWYCIYGSDHYRNQVTDDSRVQQLKRIASRGLKCKSIAISKTPPPPLIPELKYLYERYFVPSSRYDMPGEVAIFGNKVVLLSYEKRPIGIMIENIAIAKAMRSFFKLAFERAQMFKRLDRE